MLEVDEHLLKERFDMKYFGLLHDVIDVCPSFCCLSGTTCVHVIVQYITITATAVYLVQRIIAACVVVM